MHSFFSLPGGRVRRRGLELVTRWLQPGCCRGNNRISQVPGEPQLSVCTCSVDSGRTARTRPLRCSSMALGTTKAKAPTKGLSKLNSMAFELAVYASQDGLPRHHARLASGRWSGATGRAFHPQGSYERFQVCFLTSHPPFPSFAWHNEIHHRPAPDQCGVCGGVAEGVGTQAVDRRSGPARGFRGSGAWAAPGTDLLSRAHEVPGHRGRASRSGRTCRMGKTGI